jgi:hypothetical protein
MIVLRALGYSPPGLRCRLYGCPNVAPRIGQRGVLFERRRAANLLEREGDGVGDQPRTGVIKAGVGAKLGGELVNFVPQRIVQPGSDRGDPGFSLLDQGAILTATSTGS